MSAYKLIRRKARWMAGCSLAAMLLALSSSMVRAQEWPLGPDLADPDRRFSSVNDFGGIGLLQTPTARAAQDGQFYGGASLVWPYVRYFVTLQATPWLEATLRYTDVRNRLYSEVPEFSGDQTFKDRSFDLKLRLLEESQYWPALALGLRDIGGTGLFQSEYIVLNKAFGSFDFSLGVAWGNLGSRGHLRNPLTLVSDRFEERGSFVPGGGTFNSAFFRGEEVGIFGGITWDTPVSGLKLKLEYDANDYQTEALGIQLETDAPINAALEYSPWKWLNLGLGLERGNRAMFRLAATTNFNERSRVPKIDPPPPALVPRSPELQPVQPAAGLPDAAPSVNAEELRLRASAAAARNGLTLVELAQSPGQLQLVVAGTPLGDSYTALYQTARDVLQASPQFSGTVALTLTRATTTQMHVVFRAEALRSGLAPAEAALQAQTPAPAETPSAPTTDVQEKLAKSLRNQGGALLAADYAAPRATLFIAQGRYREFPRAVGRMARAAAAVLPPVYEAITLIFVEGGIEMVQVELSRTHLERTVNGQQSVEEFWNHTELSRPGMEVAEASHPQPGLFDTLPTASWSLRPALRQTLGRPEAFILYQLWARLSGSLQFSPGLTASGSLGFNIADNFERLRIPSDSVLPRVRSDIKEYLAEGRNALTHLQMDYVFDIDQDLYGHLYGGLLEEMFGGVGGEILYRPFDTNWAIGADLNWVQQRDYDQWFEFRDYNVVTGHVTGYYHFEPWRLDTRIRVGRYLAGDVGATFEVSRTFDSGITVGAFATKTDVSAAEFGEGRFDKGLYVFIPLDQLYVRAVRGGIGWLWRPVVRDGGQTLLIRRPLIATTGATARSALRRDWNQLLE